MKTGVRSYVRKKINSLLGTVGFEIVRIHGYKDFLQFKDTLREAEKAGITVGDYIELKYNVQGTYQQTLKKMDELNVFDKEIDRVCEIGPGSGRYLKETYQYCNPGYYEIYETSSDWAEWLVKQYGVKSQPCNEVSLVHTPDRSIDLVQAHKVFPGLPFFTTVRYFAEMVRVLKDGGRAVFDIFTEDCMDDATVVKWLNANVDSWNFTPTVVPKKYAIDFFSRHGFSLVVSFFAEYKPGKTECMVFSR